MNIKRRALLLLKAWCDKILETEVKETNIPCLKGGLLCPACSHIHGRIADLCFPFMTLYKATGEKRYLDAAKSVIDWSENNVLCEDGTYRNDVSSTWKGISAFSAMAIGECIIRFKDLLDSETYDKWYNIFFRLADGIIDFFKLPFVKPNVNYSAGITAMSAMAFEISGQNKYKDFANLNENICYNLFDSEGLLAGEGRPVDAVTEKGCRLIDLGYNLEESLPLLVLYSIRMKNEEKLKFYTDRVLNHLEFILPDGAIDNSFGVRHNKWTYFGSRTSDGMQEGLIYLTRNPQIAKAVYKNFELMERCTVEGYLHPGLMCSEAGELPCIHHAFAHAKSIATMCLDVNEEDFENIDEIPLPREITYGIKDFQSGNLKLISFGGFNATVNACDFIFYSGAENTGGNLTMLWHKDFGPICAATMNKYNLAEPLNMQYQRFLPDTKTMTPRVVLENYQGDKDLSAVLTSDFGDNFATVKSHSDVDISYEFREDTLKISVVAPKEGYYSLPIISGVKDKVDFKDNTFSFKNILQVTCDNKIYTELSLDKREYNPVGGFLYLPLKARLKPNVATEIVLKIIR